MVVAVGLAGAGRRAAGIHAPAIAACPKVRLAGVWGRSPALVQDLAERTGTSAYTRYADLLRDCEAVAFAVPPAVQADLAPSTAHAGKALLLEKPLGGDLAGAEQVADAVATTRVVAQLALAWRYAVAVREFLTFAAPRTRPQGGSGRVISGLLADPRWASPWQLERGVLRAYGTDLVDLLDAALGRVLAVRAHGDPGGWVGIMLEHEGGHFSEASLYAHIDHRSDGHPQVPDRAGVEVFGPGGAADVDCLAGVGQDAFTTMYDEFATAIENYASPELDVRRGLHLQQVLDNAETDLLRQV